MQYIYTDLGQAKTSIEGPTAIAAFFLPMHPASRQNGVERQVLRVLAAAQAHSVSTSASQAPPLRVLPERRVPPAMLLPGQTPAHDASGSADAHHALLARLALEHLEQLQRSIAELDAEPTGWWWALHT